MRGSRVLFGWNRQTSSYGIYTEREKTKELRLLINRSLDDGIYGDRQCQETDSGVQQNIYCRHQRQQSESQAAMAKSPGTIEIADADDLGCPFGHRDGQAQ